MATQPPVDYSQNSTPPQGRKRQGEFPGSEGGGFGVPGDDGFRKKPRFDGPPGPGESDEVPPSTLRVLIRNTDAGGIIGKGGENIKRLRKQYDCQVVLPDSAGAPERVMTMMGSTSSCISVLEDVLKGLAADARSSQPGDGDREVQILIPQQFMGTIIGTGGAKIKELRQRTKTNIKIFSDPMPRSNERSVQLMGSIAQIVECVQHILDDIGKKEPREPIYLYEPGRDMGPMDMGFQPRGRGRGGFRGRGRGRGGGDWRGGRGGGASRGRGGHFNGNNPGGMQYGSQHPPPPQAQYSSPSQPAQGYTAPPPPAGGVGYGAGATAGVAANQPSVGYTANQSPVPAANMSAPPTGMVPPPTGAYPPPPGVAQAPGTVPVPVYPQQQGPPSQPYPHQVPPNAPNTPNVGGTQSQQVTIPAEYADAITGLNGSNLQQIKTQSSCDINLEPPKPGTGDRIITITGTPNGIQFAQQLMQNSVRQHHNV